MAHSKITAKIIIIGNEILLGQTRDSNTQFLGQELSKLGIILEEVRTIPDCKETIIKTVNEMKTTCNYLFTTGGIGPTHDDITADAISKALNLEYELNQQASEILKKHYDKLNLELTKSRLKMAYMPKGSKLIHNSKTGAPGFNIDNIYVMAGVPNIMQAMFESLSVDLESDSAIISKSLEIYIPESQISAEFEELQNKYPDISMGSYPFVKNDNWGTTLVIRSKDKELLEKVMTELQILVKTIRQ